VARLPSAWTFKKGAEAWQLTEQVRISPAPKLGGWAGEQLRFLSVSRGQSVITDVEPGSLAINRQRVGLPSMQRMWFHRQGYSLGYHKPRGSPDPAELFFFDSQARLWSAQRLPAAAIEEACAGTDQWFVACRNGRVYAFSLQGSPLWSELIPHPRRDNSTNAFWGLPIFHPRLHLAADGGMLAIGAEQHFHRYQPSGQRLWTETLPAPEAWGSQSTSTDLPTREERLATLGLTPVAGAERVRTGYLRLRLDTLLDAGWLKQVQVSDLEGAAAADENPSGVSVQIGIDLAFQPGVSVLRASFHAIIIGTQDGLVHVFDRDGRLQQTFQVGRTAVSGLLIDAYGIKAAYCAGRLTLFEDARIGATIELPEYLAELEACGSGVLAWKSNAVWLVEASGRVQLAATTDRPIRGCWGHATGFYVLAGELASFHARPQPTPRRRS
jgi:hypothetical protein